MAESGRSSDKLSISSASPQELRTSSTITGVSEKSLSALKHGNISSDKQDQRSPLASRALYGASSSETTEEIRYIYDLPFRVRKAVCDLLDADNSWRQLGGQYMGINTTQLTLINHALYRGASPTNDLLTRWEAKNPKIRTLFRYLADMNHQRAMRVLKPYVESHLQSLCLDSFHDEDDDELSDQLVDFKRAAMSRRAPSLTDSKYAASGGELTPTVPMGAYRGSPLAPIRRQSEDSNMPDSDVMTNAKTPITPMEHGANMPMDSRWNDTIAFEKAKAHNQHLNVEFNFVNDLNSDRRARPEDRGPSANTASTAPEIQITRPTPPDSQHQRGGNHNGGQTSFSLTSAGSALDEELKVPYKELVIATDDFAQENILGSGGFGVVYRGEWKGTQVAVKRLKDANQLEQVLTELRYLNRYRIDNILPLYAVSLGGPEACLLYQYMPNGSLEDRLLCKGGTRPLSWSTRAVIGEGVARALNYLHTLQEKALVHGDVKSANVLLDAQFEPKLGDFGLARPVEGPGGYTHCTVSSVHGTSVYLPPEYLRQKRLSPAVDTYSYGIVLLEMATGRRPYDGRKLLLDWVGDELKELAERVGVASWDQLDPNYLLAIKDKRLSLDTDSTNWFENLLRLGIDCAARLKRRRPAMHAVLEYYSQCRTRDRIRRISANQNGEATGSDIKTGSSPAQLRSPLELQLYYDIRRAGVAGGGPESTVCPTVGTIRGADQTLTTNDDRMRDFSPEIEREPKERAIFPVPNQTDVDYVAEKKDERPQSDQSQNQSPNKSSSTDECGCGGQHHDHSATSSSDENNTSGSNQAETSGEGPSDPVAVVPTLVHDFNAEEELDSSKSNSNNDLDEADEDDNDDDMEQEDENQNVGIKDQKEDKNLNGIESCSEAATASVAQSAIDSAIPLITELGLKDDS